MSNALKKSPAPQTHTPGPWSVFNGGQGEFMIATIENGPRTVVSEIMGECPIARANALLLAAAPDAFALFEDLQEYLCEHGGEAVELLERVDAWLAKATGGAE